MANTKRVQFRRGTAAEHQTFTGAPGEVTVNTTNNSVHVHNGITTAGQELARIDLDNVSSAEFSGDLTVNTVGISSTTGVTIGVGNTELVVKGDARITGVLTVGSSSITIDGINDLIISETVKASRLTITDDPILTNSFETTIKSQLSPNTTEIPVDSTEFLEVDDRINLDGYYTNVPIVGLGTVVVTPYYSPYTQTTTTVVTGIGSTLIGIASSESINTDLTNYITIGNYLTNVEVTGITTIAVVTNVFGVIGTTGISTTVSIGSTILGVNSIVGIKTGDFISINQPQNSVSIAATVNNLGFSDYIFTGGISGTDPSISLNTGDTLTLNINASGHPFWIQTSPGPYNPANVVTGPTIVGNGTSVGIVTWTPQSVGTYYYVCQNHSVMGGSITVSAVPTVGIITNVPIVDFTTVNLPSYYQQFSSSGISTTVSIGSTIIPVNVGPSSAYNNSYLNIDGIFDNVEIVGLTTVPLPDAYFPSGTFSISTTVGAASTTIYITPPPTGVTTSQYLFIDGVFNNVSIVSVGDTYIGIDPGDTYGSTISTGTIVITNNFLTNRVGDAVLIGIADTHNATISTGTTVGFSTFITPTTNAVVIGTANTVGTSISTGTAVSFTQYIFIEGPAITIGGAIGSAIPAGSVVGFSTLYNVRPSIIIDYVNSVGSFIPNESVLNVLRYDTIGSNLKLDYVNVLGITTSNDLIVTDHTQLNTVVVSSGSTFNDIHVQDDIVVDGDARVVGILSVGSGTVTINGDTNTLNIGNNVSLHTNTSRVNHLRATGISTFENDVYVAGTSGSKSIRLGVGNTELLVTGNERVTETLTIGSDIVLDGTNNKVSSGIGSFKNLIVSGQGTVNINHLNVSGIVTAGRLVGAGISFPTADGLPGQVVTTDGFGNLSFKTGGAGGSDYVIRVSQANGNDDNDGSILPVRTLKKATQLASKIGQRVTIYVETGEYIEDNPIIVYDDVSIIGDSLRNIIVRPLNAGKDLFKVRSACYITGMTFNDYVDPNTQVPQHTYEYSVAFDDPFNPNLDRTGYACAGILSVTDFKYNHITGIATVTTQQQHELYKNLTVRLAGLAFTCGYDEVGINTFAYDNTTGVSTITFFSSALFGETGNKGYKIGDELFLANLPFTCAAEHAGVTTTIFPYPGLDPTYGAVYPITGINTATKTVTIQGGISTIPHVYEGYPTVAISTFAYTNTTGISTAVTASPHGFKVGDRIAPSMLQFTCPGGSGITTDFFPDGTVTDASNDGYTFVVTSVPDSTTFVYNAGISTIPHTYLGGGTVRRVPIVQEVWRYPEKLSSGNKDFPVRKVINDYTFEIKTEPHENGWPHYYVQDGTARLSKPVINKSPYIQNCSIISSLGGNGILVDGDKVLSPNKAVIPELGEKPPVGDQPEFGKSMVAATFTMISFGGVGWRTINDGYAQVVSCFQIFCRYGSLTQSGGYLSITNSATNFGLYALRSTGYSRNSFAFDRGRIASTGVSGGLQTLKAIGLGRADQELFVLKFFNNALEDKTSLFKPLVITQEFTGAAVDAVNDIFNIAGHPFQNEESVIYYGDESVDPPITINGLVSGNIYYIGYINASSFRLYEDEGLETLVSLGSTFVGINTFVGNNQEFVVNEVIDKHNSYQTISLGSTSNPLVFIPGRQITQTLPAGTATGIALTYTASTRELIVSVESVAGSRRFFSTTGNPIVDHSPSPVSVGLTAVQSRSDYWTSEFKVDSTQAGNVIIGISTLPENYQVHFHRPSIINSSSHTWEYAGSGIDYNALPQNGGKADYTKEQVSQLGGRVYASGTNELGDFKIGDFITAYNRTGNIIFNNKVTIGQLDSLRLSLSGGVVVEEFSTDQNLGETEIGGPLNKRVSTQLAVRSFLNNRLGDFIDKTVSTSAIPNSVVQLNSNGQINPDLIPPKVVNFITTNVNGARTTLVNRIPAANIKQGDTVVEPENSYVLVNDTLSEFLILDSDTRNYNFQNGDQVVSALSAGTAIGIVTAPTYVGYGTTGLVKGVAQSLKTLAGGSGYTNPGIYTSILLDTVTGVGTDILATITIGAGGNVTAIGIETGGRYYQSDDILTIHDPSRIGGRSGGSNFTIKIDDVQTRLYMSLTNNAKFPGTAALPDFVADGDAIGIGTTVNHAGLGVTFSPTNYLTGGSVDFANYRIILPNNGFDNGDPVVYSAEGGNGIGGLTSGQTYYIKKVGISSVELHPTYGLSSVITLLSSGTGVHSLTRTPVNTDKNTIIFKNHGFTTGDPVKLTDSAPTGLSVNSYYYVGSATTNSFTLHGTRAEATASVNGFTLNAVGITTVGTATTLTFTKQNVQYSATVNTSSSIENNWSLLAKQDIDAANIVTGTVSPSRLGSGSATEFTFLAGDSSFKKVIRTVGIGTTTPLQIQSTSQDLAPGGIGTNYHYGDIRIEPNRVQASLDLYSTLGIARFKTSTFEIGADGAVGIKNSTTGDIDASTLGGQSGSYYLSANNHTGIVQITRGGTGLNGVPQVGSILIGNGSAYNLTNTPTFTGHVGFNAGLTVTGVATATDFNATSDINLKTNIRTIENSLDIISEIEGVRFDWKETQRPSMGVIAQEVEKVLPELIGEGETKSVNYNGLIGVLIEAVKELQKEVNELKEKLDK